MKKKENLRVKKYFMISSGRAGSTICSSILAGAGANFGVEQEADWNKSSGAYELKESWKATEHHDLEVKLKKFSHASLLRMWRRKYHRNQTKRFTRKMLDKADFVKFSNSSIVRLAPKLGCSPSIILLYRPFAEYMFSSFLRSGRPFLKMREHFIQTYATGLVALKLYGGCVIRYDEIINKDSDDWIKRISSLTNLNVEQIILERNRQIQVKEEQLSPKLNLNDDELIRLEESILEIGDVLIPPSRLAERK